MGKRDPLEKLLFNLPAGYRKMVSRARTSDKYYSITPGYYESIVKLGCFYCKAKLDNLSNMNIDRVDNSGHYTIENIVPCCKHCNFAKRFMGVDEFLKWVNSVAKNTEEIKSKTATLKDNKDDWGFCSFNELEHNMKVIINE